MRLGSAEGTAREASRKRDSNVTEKALGHENNGFWAVFAGFFVYIAWSKRMADIAGGVESY